MHNQQLLLTQWLLKINNWSTLVITNVVCVNGLGLTLLCKCKYQN